MIDLNKLKAKIEALPVHEMDTMQGVIDVVDREAVLVLLATHAAEPAPVAVEPVAWQRLVAGRTEWQNIPDEEVRHHKAMGHQVRPLYTHPPRSDLAPTGNTSYNLGYEDALYQSGHRDAAPTGNTALVEAGKQALAELANVNMHLPLRDWQRISSTILAALSQPAAPQPTPEVEALEAMVAALCGPTGFAACVRQESGKAYPWPALDIAEGKARAALARGSVAEKGEKT